MKEDREGDLADYMSCEEWNPVVDVTSSGIGNSAGV
jgi:hypothetical protein